MHDTAHDASFWLQPQFWVAVAFLLLIYALYKPVSRLAVKALDERSARIRQELEDAIRLKEEARVLLAAYQKKQQESLKEAQEILTKTRADADRMAKDAEAQLHETIEKRQALAMERIAQAEAKALNEVQHHVVDIAIGAARAIVRQQLAKGSAEEMVQLATADIARKLH